MARLKPDRPFPDREVSTCLLLLSEVIADPAKLLQTLKSDYGSGKITYDELIENAKYDVFIQKLGILHNIWPEII